MKRFIINFFGFILFSVFLYVSLVVVFGSFSPRQLNKNLPYKLGGNGFLYTRLREADSVKNVDILFLGSSHTYRGYDPRIFNDLGLSVFNLGSSAQTPVQTEFLVKNYLESLNPKFVVFDIYPDLFNSDGTESTLDIISNSKKVSPELLSMALDIGNIKIYNTLLFAYYRQLFGLNNNYKEPLINEEDHYVKGGYVETFKIYKPVPINKSVEYKVGKTQLQAFERIISVLKEKKIPFLLAQAPLSYNRFKAISNMKATDSIFEQYGKYINFNYEMDLSDSIFADNGHLNQSGVEIFDRALIRFIPVEQLKQKFN